jgi:hypothetical protein
MTRAWCPAQFQPVDEPVTHQQGDVSVALNGDAKIDRGRTVIQADNHDIVEDESDEYEQ